MKGRKFQEINLLFRKLAKMEKIAE
jgi:hypothetical protein